MRKPTKNCCKNCVHYELGYSYTTQIYPIKVCKLKKKKIYRADYMGERGRIYYYHTTPFFNCDKYQKKDD